MSTKKLEKSFRNMMKSNGNWRGDYWNNLHIDDKVKLRDNYLRVYDIYLKNTNRFGSMYDIRNIRISQLSDKHISRILDFKNYFHS